MDIHEPFIHEVFMGYDVDLRQGLAGASSKTCPVHGSHVRSIRDQTIRSSHAHQDGGG